MFLALLALAAQAASPPAMAPAPTRPRTVRNWYVACDNGRRCQASTLFPEGQYEGLETGFLDRGAGADARAAFYLTSPEQVPARITIDGQAVAATFGDSSEGIRVVPSDQGALLTALRNGQWLELRSRAGTITGRVSLAGAAGAMLHMDEMQGRLGTGSALSGPHAAATRPAPLSRALPVIRLARTTERAAAIPAAEIARLRTRARCRIADVGGPDEHETGALGDGRTLILLACGTGAYNLTYVPFVATRQGRAWRIVDAPFDVPLDSTEREEGHRILINADFNQANVSISDFAKGRGIGDCGVRSRYGWDGTRFRLVHREEMGECRGSIAYVTTWRADVR